jgi:hypothetical protein
LSLASGRATASPGHRCGRRYRKGSIFVHDERRDQVVYEGPDAADVPVLMDALVDSLHTWMRAKLGAPASRASEVTST